MVALSRPRHTPWRTVWVVVFSAALGAALLSLPRLWTHPATRTWGADGQAVELVTAVKQLAHGNLPESYHPGAPDQRLGGVRMQPVGLDEP
jgi:hypothetical protein